LNAKNAKPKKEAQARRPSRKAKVKATLGEFDLRDYRNVEVLRRFLSETGKILPRRRTGLSAQGPADPGQDHQAGQDSGASSLHGEAGAEIGGER
jgi:ribosomal protein S18